MKLRDGNWSSVPSAAMRGVFAAWSVSPLRPGLVARAALGKGLVPTIVLAWVALGITAQLSASAAPAAAKVAASPASYTVDLAYQETDEELVTRPVDIKLQSNPFQKEPALPGQKVFRGSLVWGSRPEQDMAFIWDKGRGRLLLDLNRNRDLTDDPKGLFASASRDDYQSFTNIHMVLPTAAGDRSVRLELDFSSYQAGTMRAYAGLCSYWQTRLSVRGKEWQFGLVENVPDGKAPASPKYVLLRPWAERERAFHLGSSTPDGFDYTKNLFFDNRAYELDSRYDAGGDSPKYKVTFKEQDPRLGDLKVTGSNLHRVILTMKPAMTVILDQPQGTVKLPVGSYALAEIWLRAGEAEVGTFSAGKLSVSEQRPASLLAGGPLTNSVEVKSERDSLRLNYVLLGADGRAYKNPRPDTKHPPEFAVFQGTNRLATGKFNFG
jgi:hypothetical protein